MGSDDHAEAAANLFSLIASCKLHRLDPEAYLRDLFRVLAHWPRDRYLELAPRYWAETRARLDPRELELPLGHLTVPEPPAKKPAKGGARRDRHTPILAADGLLRKMGVRAADTRSRGSPRGPFGS